MIAPADPMLENRRGRPRSAETRRDQACVQADMRLGPFDRRLRPSRSSRSSAAVDRASAWPEADTARASSCPPSKSRLRANSSSTTDRPRRTSSRAPASVRPAAAPFFRRTPATRRTSTSTRPRSTIPRRIRVSRPEFGSKSD